MVPTNLIENFKLSNWILELISKIKLIKNKENFKTRLTMFLLNLFLKISLRKYIYTNSYFLFVFKN